VESFELSPTNSECDAILPFWWIEKYLPTNLLGIPEEVHFLKCQNYSEAQANEFSIAINTNILDYPEAMVIGARIWISNILDTEWGQNLLCIPVMAWTMVEGYTVRDYHANTDRRGLP
jgi:hypothetical protein